MAPRQDPQHEIVVEDQFEELHNLIRTVTTVQPINTLITLTTRITLADVD